MSTLEINMESNSKNMPNGPNAFSHMFINMVARDIEHRGVEHYFDKAFGLGKILA